jgi:hypothetical protein
MQDMQIRQYGTLVIAVSCETGAVYCCPAYTSPSGMNLKGSYHMESKPFNKPGFLPPHPVLQPPVRYLHKLYINCTGL